ncbi:MAG: hypothetical protein BM564_01655 [Bacteroidetes bacterium MedPE-SWsnd-G2]|nr:MAG: hypothetical protein BM564_01655 [Bacteroidetes bacterium MedPE-SWsnd-G2]
MKRFALLLILIGLPLSHSFAQISKQVLFLGNSYTGANNLPLIIQNMAENTGDVLIYDSNTPGGHRFLNHAVNSTSLAKINAEQWDYVVLQGQSQETSWSASQMATEVYPHVETLTTAIRANYDCSNPLFYMTWGRENGDANNCEFISWVCTYEGMDDAIYNTYMDLAEVNEGEVAPAGAVWRYLRTNHPEIDLYTADGSHPSLAGSYAAACAFYTMIYKKDPSLITWNSTLSEADANTIKLAAKTVVFNQIETFDFTTNLADASFNEVITNTDVNFTNTSTNFDAVSWDFGDDNTSTQTNPQHTYATAGDYTVTLTTTKCGKTATTSKVITVTSALSLDDESLTKTTLFPIPVKDSATIQLNNHFSTVTISIFDMNGKRVSQFQYAQTDTCNLDVSHLKSGVYMAQIVTETSQFNCRLIKD